MKGKLVLELWFCVWYKIWVTFWKNGLCPSNLIYTSKEKRGGNWYVPVECVIQSFGYVSAHYQYSWILFSKWNIFLTIIQLRVVIMRFSFVIYNFHCIRKLCGRNVHIQNLQYLKTNSYILVFKSYVLIELKFMCTLYLILFLCVSNYFNTLHTQANIDLKSMIYTSNES